MKYTIIASLLLTSLFTSWAFAEKSKHKEETATQIQMFDDSKYCVYKDERYSNGALVEQVDKVMECRNISARSKMKLVWIEKQ